MKGVVNASLANLQIGQRITAVGDVNNDGSIIAKLVHVIPGKATGILKKNPLATPSATLSITPALSPSPTATISPVLTATPSPTLVLSPTPLVTINQLP